MSLDPGTDLKEENSDVSECHTVGLCYPNSEDLTVRKRSYRVTSETTQPLVVRR